MCNQWFTAAVTFLEGLVMNNSQLKAKDRCPHAIRTICCLLAGLVMCVFVAAPPATAQSPVSGPTAAASCPVQFLNFNPGGVTVRIKNVSSKAIVGLVFNAAIADAAEHWKWLHWNFDDGRPIQDFGWNKTIKTGAAKSLSWYRYDLDFEHGGGGAFVLTSVLFEDGASWEETGDGASCKYVWYNNHKKFFAKPVQLPFR
jgi:hypothetical protein